MMSNLTEDLIDEILCRVPATSLKRLRSTCKRFDHLFNDIRFAGKHLVKAPKQSLVLMLTGSKLCSMSIDLPSVEITGELSLIDPLSSSDQYEIDRVFHCEGLLLCTFQCESRIVVWNPCTGQSKWIQPGDRHKPRDMYALGSYKDSKYALGSYKDSKSGSLSFKILSYYWFYGFDTEFKIYDMSSNSWRVLDVTPNCDLIYLDRGESLKGKTYWFASDDKDEQLGVFLVCFDYTTERFERLCLPCHCPINGSYQTLALSIVREEKLSVLIQGEHTSRTDIWLTNKVDETKVVSWFRVLVVDLKPELDIKNGVSFLVDEELEVLLCCDKYYTDDESRNMVHIFGEDNQVRQVDLGVELESHYPFLFNYAPSLAQLQ